MLDKLVAVTDAINLANDRDGLFQAVEAGCNSFGFDGFVLFCHKSGRLASVVDATLTNASRSFLADYEQRGWWEEDFFLDEVISSKRAVVWSCADRDQRDDRQRRYLDFLIDSQMLQGLAVPLKHRPGTTSGFAINCRAGETLRDGSVQVAKIIGNAAMTKAEILGLCEEVPAEAAIAMKKLSIVQHEVLSWIAQGKSNVDIATIVDLNERAVRYHVTEILRKLGVVSRAQAATIWRVTGAHRA